MKPLRREKKSAHEQFAAEVRKSEPELDLARAALLIAHCDYPALDVESYLVRLDEIAETISQRLRALHGDAEPATISIIHEINDILYSEIGLRGNAESYYDPKNSFLNEVLDRRLGIPITLAVIYIEIGHRLGLNIGGVGLPGHFLVKCVAEEEFIIDAFNGGRRLYEEDCRQLLVNIYGENAQLQPAHLRMVSKREILARMLSNLKNIYITGGDNARALAIIERILLVTPDSINEIRDRGLLNFKLSRFSAALKDLEYYLTRNPEGPEAESVRHYIARIKSSLASLN
jgi:regulator of sirC expression with transglutaminase-like and TPR domain